MFRNRVLFVMVSLFCMVIIWSGINNAGEQKFSKKKIPAAVLSAFQSKYPNAKIKGQSVETEKGIKYYEIESVDGKINRNLLYTSDGKIKEIEESMDIKTLPAELKSTLDKEFPKGKILTAEKVTSDTVITYEFQIKDGKKTKGVTLNSSGKILKGKKGNTEKEENENEEEENEKE